MSPLWELIKRNYPKVNSDDIPVCAHEIRSYLTRTGSRPPARKVDITHLTAVARQIIQREPQALEDVVGTLFNIAVGGTSPVGESDQQKRLTAHIHHQAAFFAGIMFQRTRLYDWGEKRYTHLRSAAEIVVAASPEYAQRLYAEAGRAASDLYDVTKDEYWGQLADGCRRLARFEGLDDLTNGTAGDTVAIRRYNKMMGHVNQGENQRSAARRAAHFSRERYIATEDPEWLKREYGALKAAIKKGAYISDESLLEIATLIYEETGEVAYGRRMCGRSLKVASRKRRYNPSQAAHDFYETGELAFRLAMTAESNRRELLDTAARAYDLVLRTYEQENFPADKKEELTPAIQEAPTKIQQIMLIRAQLSSIVP